MKSEKCSVYCAIPSNGEGRKCNVYCSVYKIPSIPDIKKFVYRAILTIRREFRECFNTPLTRSWSLEVEKRIWKQLVIDRRRDYSRSVEKFVCLGRVDIHSLVYARYYLGKMMDCYNKQRWNDFSLNEYNRFQCQCNGEKYQGINVWRPRWTNDWRPRWRRHMSLTSIPKTNLYVYLSMRKIESDFKECFEAELPNSWRLEIEVDTWKQLLLDNHPIYFENKHTDFCDRDVQTHATNYVYSNFWNIIVRTTNVKYDSDTFLVHHLSKYGVSVKQHSCFTGVCRVTGVSRLSLFK